MTTLNYIDIFRDTLEKKHKDITHVLLTPMQALELYREVNKKWLTQKRHSEEDNEVGTGMWNYIIDKLLEELKQ